MRKIDEIKEALDACDWPEHEFRGYCYTLIANLEIALEALDKISQDAAASWIADDAKKAIDAINND